MRTHVHTERQRATARPLSACMLASALALVAIAGLINVAPAGWHALRQVMQTTPTPGQCSVIADATQRLGCYDRAEKNISEPAKGAIAPLATR